MNSLYLLLTAILVLFSWIGSAYALPLQDGSIIPNLLSEEGIRWLVRHSVDNITTAPLAEVLLILIAVGALHGSGLLNAIIHHERNTNRRDGHALRIALAIMMICVGLVLVGIAPGGNLLSVTGHIAGGPFASGWIFLLTLIVSIPSIVYGWMSGRWHNGREMYARLSSKISSCASYFITLVVASQLLAVAQYIHLFELLKVSHTLQKVIITLVYAIPLIILFVTNKSKYDTSSAE